MEPSPWLDWSQGHLAQEIFICINDQPELDHNGNEILMGKDLQHSVKSFLE